MDDSWQERARCAGSLSDLLFEPDYDDDRPEGITPTAWGAAYRSKQIEYELMGKIKFCSRCPVRNECAAAGWDEPHGLRGGLTPAERRRIDERGPFRRKRYVRPNNPDREDMVQLVIDGENFDTIAEKYGISRQKVYDLMREHLYLVTQSNVL